MRTPTYERLLMYASLILVFIVGLCLCIGATAQTVPSEPNLPTFFTPNPEYWYKQYVAEKARSAALIESGKAAIGGLQADLQIANKRIVDADSVIKDRDTFLRVYSDEITLQRKRVNDCQDTIKPITDERDRLKGKTAVGRLFRSVRNKVLTPIGGAAILFGVLKVVL